MNNFDKITIEAVNNYFSALSKLGYLSDKKTNQLLLLIFLDDFLNDFQGLINEEDYNLIDNILTCLQGTSCLVPYAKYNLVTEPIKNYLINIPIRITETIAIRTTEESNLRLPNQL